MAKILVIVVTYNAMHWLDRCLGSVRDCDAVVVDNGSTDGTVRRVRENFPWVTLVETGSNIGFGAANNLGLRMFLDGDYEYAYLLNQDAWLEADTLSRLVGAWQNAPADFGILSPVQMNADGKVDGRFDAKCGRNIQKSPEKEVVEVNFAMAAHWLMSREAVEAVGGFSPAFRQYGEDDNYIDRLHYHGFRCGVVPSARAVHDRGGRIWTREDRMRLKLISTVVKVSDPRKPFALQAVREPLELLGMAVKNGSLAPVKYIPELAGRYPELRKLRKESQERTAFMKQ